MIKHRLTRVSVVLAMVVACLSLSVPADGGAVAKDTKSTQTSKAKLTGSKSDPAAPNRSSINDLIDKLEKSNAASKSAGEQFNWQVISSGGGHGASTLYQLSGTVGQTAVGFGSSANYGLSHGFQQAFGGGGSGCCVVAGDADHSGGLDVGDVVFLVSYLFQGSNIPPSCDREGDADNSGGLDVGDVVFLVSYLFQGSNIPPPPC